MAGFQPEKQALTRVCMAVTGVVERHSTKNTVSTKRTLLDAVGFEGKIDKCCSSVGALQTRRPRLSKQRSTHQTRSRNQASSSSSVITLQKLWNGPPDWTRAGGADGKNGRDALRNEKCLVALAGHRGGGGWELVF